MIISVLFEEEVGDLFFIISSNKEPVRECVGWCNVMWLFKITSLEIGTSEQLEEGLPSMRDASSSSALPKTDVVTVIQHPDAEAGASGVLGYIGSVRPAWAA